MAIVSMSQGTDPVRGHCNARRGCPMSIHGKGGVPPRVCVRLPPEFVTLPLMIFCCKRQGSARATKITAFPQHFHL
eukprot:scaffold12179_cov31-Tisochrysis_lutea.AAC.1